MKLSVICAFNLFCVSTYAFALTPVTTEAEFDKGKRGEPVFLERGESNGWKSRSVYYVGHGDNKNEPRFRFGIFTGDEIANLKEAKGFYACYRRDGQGQTRGKFRFGIGDNGKKFSSVDRQLQLPKEPSADQKNVLKAGKDLLKVLAIYYNAPEIDKDGSKHWESFIGTVTNRKNPEGRIDMSPTIEKGQDRWLYEKKFSFTVERYWNCRVDVLYQLKPS